MSLHSLYLSLCTNNVNDKLSVVPDGLIHPVIHLSLSSHLSVCILVIILTYIFFVSNHHPLYFSIRLTGLFNFVTHVIQYIDGHESKPAISILAIVQESRKTSAFRYFSSYSFYFIT